MDQIVEQDLVDVARQKPRQFPAQPIAQVLREGIPSMFQPMQDEGPEQYLASCILGALLLVQSCLQRLLARFKLGKPFFDGFAGHDVFLVLHGQECMRGLMPAELTDLLAGRPKRGHEIATLELRKPL